MTTVVILLNDRFWMLSQLTTTWAPLSVIVATFPAPSPVMVSVAPDNWAVQAGASRSSRCSSLGRQVGLRVRRWAGVSFMGVSPSRVKEESPAIATRATRSSGSLAADGGEQL